jgi:O-antigen/teichoic acid export membrane protein
VNLIVNTLLIPRLGASGAAIGTVVAELVVWIYQYAALKDMVKGAYQKMQYWKLFLALIVGSVASYWVKFLSFGIKTVEVEYFVKLIFSAGTFFGAYFVVLSITRETFVGELLNGILKKLIIKQR